MGLRIELGPSRGEVWPVDECKIYKFRILNLFYQFIINKLLPLWQSIFLLPFPHWQNDLTTSQQTLYGYHSNYSDITYCCTKINSSKFLNKMNTHCNTMANDLNAWQDDYKLFWVNFDIDKINAFKRSFITSCGMVYMIKFCSYEGS